MPNLFSMFLIVPWNTTKNTWKHHKFILKKVLRFILKKNCQMCLLSWKNVSYPKEQKTIFKKIFQPNS